MLETPSIHIDAKNVKRNISNMAKTADNNGVQLRPHIKTHKMPGIAQEQMKAGAAGIAVAKTTEAEVMADGGINDIFIAYPVITDAAIDRVLTLNTKIRLIVGIDSLEGAQKLSERAESAKQNVEVRMEIDTGLKRTGVPYEQILEKAKKIIKFENLTMTGIYTFRGAVLQGEPTMDLKSAGFEEGELMVSAAKKLQDNGIHIKDVSIGSTPTAKYAVQVEGVTEVRPGTYVFYDRMQAEYGVCDYEDCAAAVKATIISQPSADLLVIDGGSKTFATDVQPGGKPLYMKGFGTIKGHPDAVLERMTEEHGMIRVPENSQLKIGDTLDIIPNHICSTINLHNFVYIEDEGEAKKVPVAARGKLQ